MPKKSFPLRLDDERVARLARVAAQMQMSKTEIIEAGIDMRLDLLEGYVAMDRGAPKRLAEALTRPDPLLAKLSMKPASSRSVRGYAIDGSPIYR